MASRADRMGLLAGLLGSLLTASVATAQVAVANATEWSRSIWSAAAEGSEERVLELLAQRPELDAAGANRLTASVELLRAGIAKREEARAEEIRKVTEELDKHLAAGDDDLSLSRALRSAVELHMISTDKAAVLADLRVQAVRRKSEVAARAAEERGDWFTSSELFARLDNLCEDNAEYRDDLRRQGARLSMIRLYTPQRFWELRNQRRLAEDEKPLPPYNPVGDAWEDKLAGISRPMVVRALERAALEHVDRELASTSRLLSGGLASIRTMLTTEDLAGAFPGLRNPDARAKMLAALAEEEARLMMPGGFGRGGEADTLLRRVLEANRKSVNVAEVALLHEFGNGAMGRLDEFSGIIWPDEIRRFKKSTEGNFIGVGIQIQLDELSNIRVVTPLEGTPAQRAGVRIGDMIKKVNGKSTLGFTLDQAVDVITGPVDTPVTLTLERETNGQPQEIDMRLFREKIEIVSVKGWKRLGAAETRWDWFIDPELRIGYVRLLGFTERTDQELDEAIEQMRDQGVRGLILDLRFNPGGLLEQAVSVTSRLVDPPEDDRFGGVIVSTHGQNEAVGQREYAHSRRARLAGLPVVVLVNEGSASASEIVSGAIQDYASTGVVRGVVIGQRTFGKGSVQNVWQLPGSGVMAAVKLTTQYYRLPGGRLIHRKPGADAWGVQPNYSVEMLPKQIAESFTLRQNADVLKIDDKGVVQKNDKEPTPDPEDLITKGIDLQLQQALVLLQTQTLPEWKPQAHGEVPVEAQKKN